MEPVEKQLVVEDIPPHVENWSAANIPGFITAVLGRWRRRSGELPARFVMVICPQIEVDAMGGLPDRVRELTNPRLRFLHFTGCHKPFVVLLCVDDDAEQWRTTVQPLLSWSESYQTEMKTGKTCLTFIEAIEERDDIRMRKA